ncbi:MAG: hypothetical protein K2M06_05585 [Muribaculaceae bacterium]|nr:hypothetical protein [Muribaculaceae bacterium]
MPCNKKKSQAEEVVKDVKMFPGAAIDSADKEEVDRKLVKERTATLNNNPRNDAE